MEAIGPNGNQDSEGEDAGVHALICGRLLGERVTKKGGPVMLCGGQQDATIFEVR